MKCLPINKGKFCEEIKKRLIYREEQFLGFEGMIFEREMNC